MTIKLIAIDIDGTLIDSNHQLKAEVVTALQKQSAKGVKVVLCSGRPLLGMQPFTERLGLAKANEYTISYNGALVHDNGQKDPLLAHTLNHADFLRIEALSRELNIHMHTLDLKQMYTANQQISEYTVYESYATKMPLHYRAVADMPTDLIINKIMLIDHPEILDQAIPKIPQAIYDDYYVVKSMPFFLEVLHKEVSKGNALHQLASSLGIKAEEVMAIGDNDNDIEMLTYAGVGVAMANATDSVKAVADYITKSNEQAGVAYAVDTWT